MYGTRLPKFDDDSGDVLIKIIRHIICGILKDVASGIAYIHKKFRFHCLKMADFCGHFCGRWHFPTFSDYFRFI